MHGYDVDHVISYSKNVSIRPLPTLEDVKKKALSVAALSLCLARQCRSAPVSEVVCW